MLPHPLPPGLRLETFFFVTTGQGEMLLSSGRYKARILLTILMIYRTILPNNKSPGPKYQ